MQPYQPTAGERALLVISPFLLLSVLVVGAVLARRNLRLGRGDRRGAFRLAAFVFAAWAVAVFFGGHHIPNTDEFTLFIEFLAWGLVWSCFIWVLYVALEPYVRRRWPATLVSWSRLLAGGFRDPLVGRDVLIGCLSGASSTALGGLLWFAPSWLGYPPSQPFSGPQWQFLGARTIIADVSSDLIFAPFFWLVFLFFVFLLRTLLRKEWAAAVASVLISTVLFAAGENSFAPATLVFWLIFTSVVVFLLIRFGLLVLVANFVVHAALVSFPLTTQGSAWYAGISLAGILLMAAIAFYGFYTSLGGRPVFGGAAFEE
jgi:hypothetical protein